MYQKIKKEMLSKNRIVSERPKLCLMVLSVILCISTNLPACILELYPMGTGPTPSMDISNHIVTAAPQSAIMLNNVPTSDWTYGCSNTAAGMIFGYYDRIGYSNMYTGPANDGVAPLTDLGNQTSLIATQNGFDGRAVNGHVDDYWISFNSSLPDPWEGNWSEHAWGDCTSDFMGSNQLKWDFIGGDGIRDYSRDGITAFFAYNDSRRLYDYTPPSSAGMPQTALSHGMRLFAESRGYSVIENYTQKIDTLFDGGFSFADYMAEIDNGFPVMIQLAGHSMVGVGYLEDMQTVYLHDSWGNYLTSMPWGGSYSGMDHIAVTAIHLNSIPEPATAMILLGGLILLRCKSKTLR
ncbi:MAG: hypothetical protein ACYS9Y_14640 [Planctomycetota bacterium]|jgi:hypothetical protein